MRILIAGATGAIGRQVVPQLLDHGHDVVGMARSRRRADPIREQGVEVVLADALDRERVQEVVQQAAPDAVVNLLTALPADLDPKHIDRDTAATNRLRTEGAANLFDAARHAGVSRVVVESIAFITDPAGPDVTDETAPVWPAPPAKFAAAVDAVVDLEAQAAAHGATVLRFGQLYGPGTALAADGPVTAAVRAGKVPIVGDGGSVSSFVHVADAAAAVVAAVESRTTGLFNVVDDDPAAIGVWLPVLAELVGGPSPRRIPRWLARLVVGDYGVAWMTALRGSSNARARQRLGWAPAHPTWREGFREELAAAAARPAAA